MTQITVYDASGNPQSIDLAALVLSDLSNVALVTDLPATYAVPLCVAAPNGNRRVVMAPSGLFRAADAPAMPGGYTMTGNEVFPIIIGNTLYKITLTQFTSIVGSSAASALAAAAAALAAANAKKQLTLLGTTSVTVGGGIALLAGTTRTSKTISGIVSGEPLIGIPTSLPPTGFDVGSVFASATDTAQIAIYNPVLGIGASGTVAVSVYAFR